MKTDYKLAILAVISAFLAITGLPGDAVTTFAVPPLGRAIQSPGDWPMYGHDVSRTNYNPDETLIGAANVNQLVQRWQANIFNRPTPPSGAPSVANGKVYVGSSRSSGDNFFAFDAVTGQQAWNVNVGYGVYGCLDVGIGSTAAISGTVVSVGGGDQAYYGLDAESGAQIWRNPINLGSSAYAWVSPLMAYGRSYVGMASNCDNPSVRGEVRALDYLSGTPVASQYFVPDGQRGAGIWNSPALSPDGSTLVVTTGEDYGGYNGPYNRAIVSLDPITLDILQANRQGTTGGDVDFATSPLIFSDSLGRVLTGAVHKNSNFYAYVLSDINSGPIWSKPVTYNAGMMPAYDPTFGNGGTLFIAGSSRVYAVDPATGVDRWPSITQGGLRGNMAVANGLIFLNTGSGGLRILDETTGATLRTLAPPNAGSTYSGVAVANGFVYWLSGSYLNAWSLPAVLTPTPPSTSTSTPIAATATVTSTSTTVSTDTPVATHTSTRTSTPTITATPTPPCSLGWRISPSQNLAGPNTLYSVAAIASNDVWAVGVGGQSGDTLIQHWNGSQWTLASPTPTAGFTKRLNSVSAVGPNDVWAVGWYEGSTMGTLIEHWNGTQWTQVPSPNGAGFYNELTSVSARASNDVWAVGFQIASGSGYHTLILHWDGTSWSVIPSPDVNGNGYLRGVSADMANESWAVGTYTDGDFTRPMALFWNGTAWSIVTLPITPARGYLESVVSLPGASDVWAVGYYAPQKEDPLESLTLHWNGETWSVVPSPNPGEYNNVLRDVDASGPNDVWAAGSYTIAGQPQTMVVHWDGSAWTLMPTPDPDPSTGFWGISVFEYNDVWVVGASGTGAGSSALTERYSHFGCGTPTPTITISPTSTRTGTAVTTVTSVTPSATSTPVTATATFGAPCGVLPDMDAETSCTAPSTYSYSFSFYVESGCTTSSTGTASITFEVATDKGPWVVYDTELRDVTFPSGPGYPTFSGSLDEPGIPEEYTIYRIGFYAYLSNGTSAYGLTRTESICRTPCAIGFTDVPPDHTFYQFVRCLACRGIISGYADGTFRPQLSITRGQISKIVSNAAGFDEDPGAQIYEDVDFANPFYAWINRLSMRGYMGGYPCGTVPEEPCIGPDERPYFRPVSNASRGQLSKIVSNAAGFSEPITGHFYTDVPEDHPFYIWIMRLSNNQVLSGYPCGGEGEPCDDQNRPYFRPYNEVTRGQASKIVANAFFPGCKTP